MTMVDTGAELDNYLYSIPTIDAFGEAYDHLSGIWHTTRHMNAVQLCELAASAMKLYQDMVSDGDFMVSRLGVRRGGRAADHASTVGLNAFDTAMEALGVVRYLAGFVTREQLKFLAHRLERLTNDIMYVTTTAVKKQEQGALFGVVQRIKDALGG